MNGSNALSSIPMYRAKYECVWLYVWWCS